MPSDVKARGLCVVPVEDMRRFPANLVGRMLSNIARNTETFRVLLAAPLSSSVQVHNKRRMTVAGTVTDGNICFVGRAHVKAGFRQMLV